MAKYWWLWAIAVAYLFGIIAANCAHAGETRVLYQREEKIGWDGMPIKEKVKKNEGLTKGKHFLTATGLVLLATVADVELTFHNIKSHSAKEGNPWAAPFFNRGRGSAYAYALGVDVITMGIAYAIFKSKDRETQKYWIVLPTVCIIGHTVGIGLNLTF